MHLLSFGNILIWVYAPTLVLWTITHVAVRLGCVMVHGAMQAEPIRRFQSAVIQCISFESSRASNISGDQLTSAISVQER